VRLVEILLEAGVPAAAIALLTGLPQDLGESLMTHPGIDAISFTGSNATGMRIATRAAPSGKKVQLEMGGTNAAIVLADADLDRAVDFIVRGAMLMSGQRCTATSRAIVVDDVYDEVLERVVDRVMALQVGDPLADGTYLGPLANAAQHEKVLSLLDAARAEGLNVVCGGDGADPATGYWITPTVLDGVPPSSRLAREEIFGPVLAFMRVADATEALSVANSSRYGLSASVFTTDLKSALELSDGLEVGVVHVNGESGGAEPHVPFGGMKASSSHSREQGKAARDFFTDIKTVYLAA
jgi:aldehyde dehydrogenase (NAD+)